MELSFDKNFYGIQILWDSAVEREWYTLKQLDNKDMLYTSAESYDGHGKLRRYKYHPTNIKKSSDLIEITYAKGDPVKPKAWKPNDSWTGAIPGITRIYLTDNLPFRIEWKSERSKKFSQLNYEKEWIYFPHNLSKTILDKKVIDLMNQGIIKKPTGTKNPKKQSGSVTGYQRDAEVVAYALQEANGICQRCKNKAPFITKDGRPYLEVHHKKHLSENGPDVPENVIALCPNCHRNEHFGTRIYQ